MFKNLLNKVGWGELPSSFGYTVGDKVDLPFQSVWQHHRGQKRSDGSTVSLFICPKKDLDSSQVAAAKNAQQLSRSLKHPNIIKVLDSVETDGGIYLATEAVTPLLGLEEAGKAVGEDTDEVQPAVWGFWQTLDALAFLHSSGFVHGLFGPSAIFLSSRGDYRLAGFELCKKGADVRDLISGWRRCGPNLSGWPVPPESLASNGSPTMAIDFWGVVVMAAYVFGTSRPGRANGVDFRPDLDRASQDFPPDLRKPLAEILKPGPLRGRTPVAELIALPFFQQHPAVRVMTFLGSLHIRSDDEKEVFFENLPKALDGLPQRMQMRLVLPELLSAEKFPGQESAQVLPSILKIGKLLKEDEFKEKVAPLVVQLFVSPDRAIRFRLLMSIGDMIGNLDDAMINDKIFPECVNGFTDSSGPIREATVKALIHFVPRLKAKTIEQRVVKLLLKVIQDPEASIRTNAVICCGRISGHLPKATVSQTLSQALSCGLKDAFPPARSASLQTLLATAALFSAEELVSRLLPLVCQRLLDPDAGVSNSAFEVLSALQQHLRQLVDERRAAQAAAAAQATGADAAQGTQAAAQASATTATAAGSWGSWALSTVGSAITKKMVMGSMSQSDSGTNLSSAPGTPSNAAAQGAAPPAPAQPEVKSKPAASTLNVDDGGVAASGWGEEDDFWDDLNDGGKPAKSSALAEAPPAKEPLSVKKSAPAPATAPALSKAKAAPKASVSSSPKQSGSWDSKEDDDFWKEFDM